MGHVLPPTLFGPRQTQIYISREISIEHPSVGLASLAQLSVLLLKVMRMKLQLVKLRTSDTNHNGPASFSY